ncbi:MAG: hypothetical protein PHX78_12270 [bacterium]|nr:hypothetical protein [bacterium]
MGFFSSLFGLSNTRRPSFKKMYGLDIEQDIFSFEKKMASGMFNEGKEVHVTAFIRKSQVIKVYATIGTTYSCRSSSNFGMWGIKAVGLKATHIHSYHNHPNTFGKSRASPKDKRSHKAVETYLEQWDIEYKSFLVYQGWLGNTVISPYSGSIWS